MKCDHARRVVRIAVDGELDANGFALLAQHLADCASCRDEAETQLLVRRVLASRPADVLPDRFSERIAAGLAREPRRFDLGTWWRRLSSFLLFRTGTAPRSAQSAEPSGR